MDMELELPVKDMTICDQPRSPHPLLIDPIMKVLFRCLDPKSRKICRLVNSSWNRELTTLTPFQLQSVDQTKRFLSSFIHNPVSPYPFVHILELSCQDAISHISTLEILEENSETLSVLRLKCATLRHFPFLFLPTLCPNLEELSIDVLESKVEEFIPLPLREIWNNRPFPNLHTLKISRGLYVNPRSGVLILTRLLQKVPSIRNLRLELISTEEMSDLSNHLRLNIPSLVSRRLKSLEINRSDCNPLLRLLSAHPSSLSFLTRLTIVERSKLNKLDAQILQSSLPKIFEATSKTLVKLELINAWDDSGNGGDPESIHFPVVMSKLESICLGDVSLKPGASEEKKGISEMFPKLKKFQFWFYEHIGEEMEKIVSTTVFPQLGCFGEEPPKELKSLTEFSFYTKISSVKFVRQIPLQFPNLRSVILEIDGNLLPDVVELLKDLRIEEFIMRYYETRDLTLGLVSGLSGIPIPVTICDSFNKGCKTKASLTDWKYLRSLSISNHAYEMDESEMGDVPVASGLLQSEALNFLLDECLLKLASLEKLELRRFKILDRKVIERLLTESKIGWINISHCEMHFSRNRPAPPALYHFTELKEKVGQKRFEALITSEMQPLYARRLNYFEYFHV